MPKEIRILLIEDNLAFAGLLKIYLEDEKSFSWAINHVTSLKEALQCLDQEYFDVIITDLSFPDAKSQKSDTVKSLREKSKKTPIIILSGYSDKILRNEVLSQGAQQYISKENFYSEIFIRSILDVVKEEEIKVG